MRNDDPYGRLLRWYPKAWRETHGAVFLGTLLEQSQHEGRTRPSRGESFAAMVNGVGTRLDARLAGRMALAGIALATIVKTVTQLAMGAPVDSLRDGLLMVGYGTTGLLVLAGVVSIARASGLLSAGHGALVLALVVPAMVAFTVAEFSWALGFQAAEDNVPLSGLATAWAPLSGAAVVLGLVPSWLCAEIVLRRSRLGRVPRLVLSTLAAAAITVVTGLMALVLVAWLSVALGVLAVSLRSLGAWRRSSPAMATDAPTRRRVRRLAGVSAGIGLCGIVYVVTASTWSPIAPDATAAGAQGTEILLVGSLPLVAALGLLATARGQRRLDVWGPLSVLAVVVATGMYAYTFAPDAERMAPALFIGSVLLGLGIGWWVAARLGGRRGDRWVAGAAVTLACVAFQGAYVLPVAVFVAPALAAVLAIRGDLPRPRTRTETPANSPVTSA